MKPYFEVNEEFLECFLNPLSKIAQRTTLHFEEKRVFTTAITEQGDNIIFYGECEIQTDLGGEEKKEATINNITKFYKLLKMGGVGMKVCFEDNRLTYDSNKGDYRFKYYLMDKNFLKASYISKERIESVVPEFEFDLSFDALKKIIGLRAINNSVEKLYFKFDSHGVKVDITDMVVDNCDSVECRVADSYEGKGQNVTGIPVSSQISSILSQNKFSNYRVVYSKGVFIFKFNGGSYKNIYVVSGLKN